MKKMTTGLLALVTCALLALAAPAAAMDGMTGEVLDLGCYEKGQSGESHAKCAVRCLSNGADMGLLVDGEVYMVDTAGSDDAAVAKMREHGGKNVTVTGDAMEKDGKKMLKVKSVEAAG